MSVAFIGLGLNDERGLTIEGVEEARRSSNVFAEFYTNIMPGLDRKKLELLLGKRIVVLNRFQLEDEGGRQIVGAAERGRVAFLVPGDPMIATTHISIRLELVKRGIPSRIIHGPSIVSGVSRATSSGNLLPSRKSLACQVPCWTLFVITRREGFTPSYFSMLDLSCPNS